MTKRNLTLIFNPLWPEHLSKDVFLVPYYLGKKLNSDVSIVYTKSEKNKDLPNLVNGVKIEPLNPDSIDQKSSLWELLKTCSYIIKNAKSIDILMFIRSCSPYYELQALIYKKFNKNGKVYVKLDINPDIINQEVSKSFSFKYYIHQYIKKVSLKLVDCFSCETLLTYQQIKKSLLTEFQFGDKLRLIPNGFDEELLESLCLDEKKFDDKENLIITVGRLGSPEKNTEMFLKALDKANLNNWEVHFIGTIDPRIEETIQEFYKENPDKLNSIKFVGPIYDKKELWEYYNRAKVFVLTSNWEGYPIVFPEAKRFRNYIVSTDIAACPDVIENEKYGVSVPINDFNRLSDVLNEIITGKRNIDVYSEYDVTNLSWQSQVNKIEII